MALISRVSEPNYLIALNALSFCDEPDVDDHIHELLQNHSSDFFADLVIDRKLINNYQIIVSKLKERNSSTLNHFDYIQRAAKCLEKSDFEALENLFLQMSHLIPDLKIFCKFSGINLSKNFDEISAISNSKIKKLVIASLINRDKIPLKDLNLTVEEILGIGPFLTFVDCRGCFNKDWKHKEILSFLSSCAPNVKILSVDARVPRLPSSLPECEELDCRYADKLEKIPSLPKCKVLHCSHCNNLISISELLNCEFLDCSNNLKLKKIPSLPKCKFINCSNCKIKTINCLPRCETLDCSNNTLTTIGLLPECKILNCSNNQVLVKINSLPLCEYLSCQECINLKTLPSLPSCKYLYCNGCSSLCFLSNLNACKELYCNRCTNLVNVGMLSLCEKLMCSGSSKLKTLPELFKCKELDCSSCDNLKFIKALPLVETLNCNHCRKLDALPKLPKCQTLEICDCKQLKELPFLPCCKILNCTDCIGLNSLPDLPLCEELNCNNNVLGHISSLPKCRILNCKESLRLRELPELPACQILNCQNSINLTKLSDLPVCREFFCSGCVNITSLPDLPLCETLYCNECPKLSQLPDLFICDHLSFEASANIDLNSIPLRFLPWRANEESLQISMQELRKNPLKILFRLRDSVFEKRFMPKIQFIEKDGRTTEGIDAGGISRIFIARLMQSLILNSHKNDQLAFRQANSGLHMPYLDPTRNLKLQVMGFRILGSLFDLCLGSEELDVEYRTGILFDRELFQQILNFSFKELEHFDFDVGKISLDSKIKALANSSDSYLSKMGKLLLKPLEDLTGDEFEVLRQTIIIEIDQEEKVPEDFYPTNLLKKNLNIKEIKEIFPWISDFVKKMLINTLEEKNLVSMIIAKELSNRVGIESEFEELRNLGVENLEKKIQGVLSREKILESIEYELKDTNINQDRIDKTKGYLEKWINEASKNELENLINFIAGSPTISDSTKLFVHLYNLDANYLPTARTCFNEFKLSVKYPDFDTFKAKLESALQYASSSKTAGIENI